MLLQKKSTAEIFAHADCCSAIIYKINVPRGSRISMFPYFNFPRNSKFLCTDTRAVDDGTQSYQLISLDYLKPESKLHKIWDKILTRFLSSFTDDGPPEPSYVTDLV